MTIHSKPTWSAGRIIILGAAGLFLIALALGAIIPGGLQLRITPVNPTQAPLLVLPIEPDERFTVHYFHSVENAPIWETHSIDARGDIYIEEERYEKFGAGMGRMPGIGRMARRGKYEVIENMHMPTGNFILRIGSPGVDHTIIWRHTRTNLSAMAPHVAVQFSARPISWLHRRLRQMCPHPRTPPHKEF